MIECAIGIVVTFLAWKYRKAIYDGAIGRQET